MTFDWMEPKVGKAVRDRAAARTREAHRREVRDRARLLMNLGYSQKDAAARCRRVLAWEHDLANGKSPADDVDAIVREVYERK